MTDCAFRTEAGRFYYCVRAVIIRNGQLLAMRDENTPYYYLVGGKVGMGETAEEAVLREVKEELGIDAQIVRALWLDQSFYTEKRKNERYHEIGLYFLLNVNGCDLPDDMFCKEEGKHKFTFGWLPLGNLKNEYLYPLFLKKEIFSLPENLKIIVEKE